MVSKVFRAIKVLLYLQKLISLQKDMYWDVDPKILTYDDVKQQAGNTLAEFCRDYRTYNLVPKSAKSIAKLLNGMRLLFILFLAVKSRKISVR